MGWTKNMGTFRGARGNPMRQGAGATGGERGATMMFVLMAMILVGAITVSAMQVIGADVSGGVEELEADQVFNIASAGVHYGIGKLQVAGATTYAGEPRTITNGSTTLGTATIIVNCVDTTSVNNWTPPCASSAYPAYRRVISTGALPVSGPSRTLVAVIQSGAVAPGNWTSAFCALSSVTGSTSTVNGDMVSNGSINMTGGTFVGDAGSPPKYTGKLAAVGSITCTSPCSAAGGILPGQAGPLCSAPTMPTFSPGGTNVTVASGTTYTIPSTGGSFNNITLNAGSGGCSGFTTLQINTSTTDPTAPTVVQLNSLSMVACTRVVVTGVGKVDMRLAAATGTSLSLNGDVKMGEFGVTSPNTPREQ